MRNSKNIRQFKLATQRKLHDKKAFATRNKKPCNLKKYSKEDLIEYCKENSLPCIYDKE